MTHHARRGNLAGPVLLIAFGALVFLINTGQVPLTLWEALNRLWPLALIAIGIDLLLPRRTVLMSAVTAVVLLVVVFGGIALAIPAESTARSSGGEPVAVASTGEEQAIVVLSPATGQLHVQEMVPSTSLLAGTVRVPAPGSVATTTQTENGVTRVVVRTTGTATSPIVWGTTERWDIALSGEPDIALSSDMGAGDTVIDGRGVNLTTYNGSTGVGRIEIYIPEGATRVDLSTGIGELAIHVPEGVPVRLHGSWALGGVNFPAGYVKVNDVYLSPGYTDTGHIEINASLAIGAVTVSEY